MTYTPRLIELDEAEAIVRERERIHDKSRNPVRQAIREGKVNVFTRDALVGGDRDDLADLLARGTRLPGMTVSMAEIDRYWPPIAARPVTSRQPTAPGRIGPKERLARAALAAVYPDGPPSPETITSPALHLMLIKHHQANGGVEEWDIATTKRAAGRRAKAGKQGK